MNDYTERLVNIMLDLVNSYDPYLKEPETMPTPADLDRFMQARQIKFSNASTAFDLQMIHQTRQVLHEALATPDVERSAELLNELLSHHPIKLRLRNSLDGKTHLEYFLSEDVEIPGVKRLEMESAVGLALALDEIGKDRLKSCHASPCQEVFVDLSKNRSRRFCSDRCANRFNIAAFRERLPQSDAKS